MVKRYHYIIPKSQLVPEAAEKCEGNGSHPAPPEKRGKNELQTGDAKSKRVFFFSGDGIFNEWSDLKAAGDEVRKRHKNCLEG